MTSLNRGFGIRLWTGVLFAFCLGLLLSEAKTLATEMPAAVVEEVSENVSGVASLDFLVPGTAIELGSGGRIVLGYLKSCASETITGGRLVVGQTASIVRTGIVSRKLVECDGGGLVLAASESGKSAVVVFRKPPISEPRPSLNIYSVSPLFAAPGAEGVVLVKRLDKTGPLHRLTLDEGIVDMAAMGLNVIPGGLYSASLANRIIIFSVDSQAVHTEPASLLSRLVRF